MCSSGELEIALAHYPSKEATELSMRGPRDRSSDLACLELQPIDQILRIELVSHYSI